MGNRKSTIIFMVIILCTLALVFNFIGAMTPNRVENALGSQVDTSIEYDMTPDGVKIVSNNYEKDEVSNKVSSGEDTHKNKLFSSTTSLINFVVLAIITGLGLSIWIKRNGESEVLIKDDELRKYIHKQGIPLSPLETIELNNILDYLKNTGGIELGLKEYGILIEVLKFDATLPQLATASLSIKENYIYSRLIMNLPADMKDKPKGYEYSTFIYDMITHRKLYNEKVKAYTSGDENINLSYKSYNDIEKVIEYLNTVPGSLIEIETESQYLNRNALDKYNFISIGGISSKEDLLDSTKDCIENALKSKDNIKVKIQAKMPNPNPVTSNDAIMNKIYSYKDNRTNLRSLVDEIVNIIEVNEERILGSKL